MSSATTGARWWLSLSVPISLLGIACSLTGIFVDRIYANETANWTAQAVGQDLANLVVLPCMLVLAWMAVRGSARALLFWSGTIVYCAYTYAIYAFTVHFGPLFLPYVMILGLAAWALIGFLASIDPARVRSEYPAGHHTALASGILITLASAFVLLWLIQDLSAIVNGTTPKELRATGLPANPVHVLDLALFLPASVIAGLMLRRGRAWGHVLAPMMLTAMAGLSLGIVALIVVTLARGEQASLAVAAVVGALGLVEAVVCWLFVTAISGDARADDLLTRSSTP